MIISNNICLLWEGVQLHLKRMYRKNEKECTREVLRGGHQYSESLHNKIEKILRKIAFRQMLKYYVHDMI